MEFNEKITQLRKARGMTQEELADKVGVSRQSISKWELGDCEPDMSTLRKLQKIFGVSMDYLINDNVYNAKEEQKKEKTDKKEIYPNYLNILLIIGGLGVLAAILIVIIFPYPYYIINCRTAPIIRYLFTDWSYVGVTWRFCLFIPSVLCLGWSVWKIWEALENEKK